MKNAAGRVPKQMAMLHQHCAEVVNCLAEAGPSRPRRA